METKLAEITSWVAVQGAVAGKSHIQDNIVCQDKTFILRKNNMIAVALADGAGSARLSHFGAETVTQCVCELLCEKFEAYYNSNGPVPVKEEVLTILLTKLKQVAEENECDLSDLASTLLAVAIKNDRFLILHLGDGVIAYTKDNQIRVATAPKNGEFANVTYFITSSHALEMMQIRKGIATSIDGFVLMSDGSEASLYSKQRNEVAPVLQKLIRRLSVTSEEFFQPIIQSSLENAISQKTRDDCSLVLVAKHLKSYNELEVEEADDYFDINVKRNCDAQRRRTRYLDILNLLDVPKSAKELSEAMELKNTSQFIKTWLSPLVELGYVIEIEPHLYKRTVHPNHDDGLEDISPVEGGNL